MVTDHLKNLLGCNEVITLTPQKDEAWGIAHIDERLKFLSNKIVLTDVPSWKNELEKLGKTVILLPRPPKKENIPLSPSYSKQPELLGSATIYRTYANAIILGDRIFVPVFGVSTDTEAIRAYEQHGYKIIPINTNLLSTQGRGSLHCISATLPSLTSNH
jgi:agmatine/peptidylarginine deiminase